MKFEKVIGQEDIKSQLIKSYHDNRISHAYLFYGIPGTGKLALAIAFAQFLSCENKKENDSCGDCPSCKKYEKLIHPDLHFVFPVISKTTSDTYIQQWRKIVLDELYFSYNEWMQTIESENKQGGIHVEEASEIIRKLNLKTYESEYKIMIIWLPEKMNSQTANKLLKILEEPPQNTVFILVSDNREEVLQTILSRTQPLKILGIADSDIKKAIIEKYGITEQAADDIVKISNGSFLEAKDQVITSDETEYNFSRFVSLMRLAYSRKIAEALKWAEDISKAGRERQKSFLYNCLIYTRENLVYNFKYKSILYMTREEEAFATNFAKFINTDNASAMTKIFNDAYYHIERNANSKIIFTDLAFEVMKVIKK
jgi:DNA polymerase-3 subunit delta'